MPEDFLSKLFRLLDIPEDLQEKLKEDFKEIINCNLTASFLNNLTEDQKGSLRELVKKEGFNQAAISSWLQNQEINKDEGFLEKLNQAVEQSIKDFFTALTKDLNEQKREEVLAFARSYTE